MYPTDKHGREYGWGWSLLTTPESLLRDICQCERTPQESFERMKAHLSKLLPEATEKQIEKLIKQHEYQNYHTYPNDNDDDERM